MVDLSDVIGRAVGGEEGDTLDYLIDITRRYVSTMENREWSDTKIVEALLYDAINRRLTEHKLQFLTDVDNNDMMYTIDRVQNEMLEQGITDKHRMEE